MAHPTPLRSFLGGLGIPVAAHELLVLNGNVFGISGFVHRGIRGSIEGVAGVAGLVLSGAMVANLEGNGPAPLSLSLPKVLLSGFLVGLARKWLYFRPYDMWGFAIFTPGQNLMPTSQNPNASSKDECDCSKDQPPNPPRRALRAFTFVATALQFGFALRLSNLTEATRVLSFLLLPIHPSFDPLAGLPRRSERPCLGGDCSVPKGGEIDARLLIGSSIFGVGWGLAGICPGPALVNFGRALGAGGQVLAPYASWIASMLVGGLLA
ncbi:hypothetical protein NLJ89_g7461 [Agrocybe chaxingu]|uniref:Uncharacterized protein n=1 Tax=Agrocybe chaxingu TaxID=84603 RepID=A0A9W8MTN7_9AGAR|nr:hypothetical protein NLJ89_g7461 [Agrocybe chaxingu]